jgi:hypothetical protein
MMAVKHLAGEKTSRALAGLTRMLKQGSRLVVFCDPIAAYQIAQEAASEGFALEHSLSRSTEIDPEFRGNYLFPAAHETVLILLYGNEPKEQRLNAAGLTAVATQYGEIPGSDWTGLTRSECAAVLVRAYASYGNHVLCATGGKVLIAESLKYGCDTVYLCSGDEKLAYYQQEFGVAE